MGSTSSNKEFAPSVQDINPPALIEVIDDTGSNPPFSDQDLKRIVALIETGESCRYTHIEVVFVSKEKILELNHKYRGHDYVTDILTFPFRDDKDGLEGTLYCCPAQIESQAIQYECRFVKELLRVVIHGLLHLAGYEDDTPQGFSRMKELEDKYLQLYWTN